MIWRIQQLAVAFGLMIGAAQALEIELKDVAADRIERQRAQIQGRLPLAGTPDVTRLAERLAAKGLAPGAPILVRIFKTTSELELWMKKGETFVLFDTYPICHWSGTLGPKVVEGDRQAPEGFYTVGRSGLTRIGRWPRSFNLGFPNAFDRSVKRTGSFILIHGGCSSVGCYAMTNVVVEELFQLGEAALKAGQDRFQVHVFPFRMTADALKAYKGNEWIGFWENLKQGYDAFEAARLPPRIGVCEGRYVVRPGVEHGASQTAKANDADKAEALAPGCATTVVEVDQDEWAGEQLPPAKRNAIPRYALPPNYHVPGTANSRATAAAAVSGQPLPASEDRALATHVASPSCNTALASCRKFMAMAHQKTVIAAHKRIRTAGRVAGKGVR